MTVTFASCLSVLYVKEGLSLALRQTIEVHGRCGDCSGVRE